MAHKPRARAILFADGAAYVQGKWTLIGIFPLIYSRRFPVNHHNCFLYVNFVDLVNPAGTEIEVEITAPSKEQAAAKGKLGIAGSGSNKPQRLDVALPLPVLYLPEPGIYEVNISAAGELIEMSTLEVVQMQPPAQGDKP